VRGDAVMLPSFCRSEITVKRANLVDKRGTTVADWTNPLTFTIQGCSVQPSTSTRDFDGRTLGISEEWTLYAPTGANLKAGDRVYWQGSVFEINGAPMPWESPTGRISHVFARLNEWRG